MTDVAVRQAADEKPRKFLQALLDRGVVISMDISYLTDDDCRKCLWTIFDELQARGNGQ